MATSKKRGWDIVYINNEWVYKDNLESIRKERVCKRCGRKPTLGGYDTCLGYIPNVISVCCGHGSGKSISLGLDNEKIIKIKLKYIGGILN